MEKRDTSLEALAAAALRRIARNESIKAYIQEYTLARDVLLRAARRFIGGEILDECLEVAAEVNEEDFAVTIDYMGESTRNAEMAREAAEEFSRVVRSVAERGLNASISLDLSHIGMAVEIGLAFDNASGLAGAAGDAGLEMMISMEGSERTEDVLETHRRLCEIHGNVGITLQAYLFRTKDDLREALERPGRIRLVKGAYEEPVRIARARGEDVDAAYRELMRMLLASGHACSIATHDQEMLDYAHDFLINNGISREPVEFEMLYGVEPERLRVMRNFGYKTRVYLPYGREWYLYLCHRLAEHPPNIYRAFAEAVGVDVPGYIR